MAMRKIMVPFLNENTATAAFGAGAVFAHRFKAHLDVIHLRQRLPPVLPGNAYYPIAATHVEENYEALTAAADKQAKQLKALYESLCSECDISFVSEAEHTDDKGATAAWADLDANISYDLANRACVSDMALLAKSGEGVHRNEFETIEEIIFQSGRAVMLVDSGNPVERFPETVMIAWNGGREAARALTSALPILQQSKLVIVGSAGDVPAALASPEHVASYLRLHGVHATHINIELSKSVDPEEEFLMQAKINNADLIVMGAYSHNRWREVILGGFTRHMLRHSSIPLLMAH